jgi:hypothetical protein
MNILPVAALPFALTAPLLALAWWLATDDDGPLQRTSFAASHPGRPRRTASPTPRRRPRPRTLLLLRTRGWWRG